jgi:hypothetical protein
LNVQVNGYLKLGDTSVTKLNIDYNVRRIGNDRVSINGKFSDKSTPVFTKYTVSGSVPLYYFSCLFLHRLWSCNDPDKQ